MTDPEKEKQPSILATAISLITVWSGLSVLVSSLYNVAYFSRLDFFTPELLTSGDLLISCLTWIPLTAPLVFLGFAVTVVLELIFSRLNAKARARIAEQKAAGTYPVVSPYRLMLRKDLPFVVMGTVVALLSYLTEPSDEWIGALTIGTVFIWPPILWAARRLDPDSKIYSPSVWFFLGVLPWLSISAYGQGSSEARHQLEGNRGRSVDLSIKGKNFHGLLLRAFEKGLFLRDAQSKQLIFLPWAQIDQVSGIAETPVETTRFCRWLGCPPPKPSNTAKPDTKL